MISVKKIENKADLILKELKQYSAPINVQNLAEILGLKIVEHDLGSNVSGMLYIEKGQGVIGCNTGESDVRKRFTIAHELGHYFLHRLDKDIFVDHKQFKPAFRNHISSTGENTQEREANAFAAAILMPKELLIKEIELKGFDLGGDDDVIGDLSKLFKVSSQAMAYRMANLNLY